MKRTINGKRYDTDKSTEVATYDSPYYATDFHWFIERLYVSPRGRWFLAGEGNALSRYASRTSDGSGPGECIIPLAEGDALAWLEQHDETTAIDEWFESEVEDA
jgi:hypothetical protein